MALAFLPSYIELTFPNACVPVDLLKIARSQAFPNPTARPEFLFNFEYPEFLYPTPFGLVIDGECCLHRLYGGFFGDWVCGGQWNRMIDYLTTLIGALANNNIEVTVFLNGASEPHRLEKWIEKQRSDKEKITQVLRHCAVKGTPPPKVWWVPPNSLRSCLRMALRYLNVNVVLSTVDHRHEVMNFVRKHRCHGLIADDPEYMIFDPPRLFSAENLKLTFKGCLETREYVMNEVTRCLNLHPSRLCIVAALLGNHIVTDNDLNSFHHALCPGEIGKIPTNRLIKVVVDFVRNIPSVDNLDFVAALVFGQSKEKISHFKQCVQYYTRGSITGNRPNSNGPGQAPSTPTTPQIALLEQSLTEKEAQTADKMPIASSGPSESNDQSICEQASASGIVQSRDALDVPADISKFASETVEIERSSLQAYRQVLSKTKRGPSSFYQILTHQDERNCDPIRCNFPNDGSGDNCSNNREFSADSHGNSMESSMNSAFASMSLNAKNKKRITLPKPPPEVPLLPKVSAEVMRIARERHQRGLMNPAVFQVLSQGELRVPTTFEDDVGRDLPSPSLLFRPVRQMVYALLFNHHHLNYLAEQKKEKDCIEEKPQEIIIKEWVWSKTNKYTKPDLVPSLPLGWAVPTITRLWFGSGVEENKRRLQAFLTCMRSNNLLMRNTNYVPQHCLIMCCVLRYILTYPDGAVLRKQELDAFLVQAVNPQLTDVNESQKIEVPVVTTRGIQLAAMFMTGVENALFANDACGAPIPWLMCCPWLYFDGKLFHRVLLKANAAHNLIDLCDNHLDEVAKVERMRTAILEGLHKVNYAHISVAAPTAVCQRQFHAIPVHVPGIGRCRGHQRVVPHGGQLEVAGVVVGSWGANYGQGPRSPTRNIPPQVVSVGASRGRSAPLLNPGRGAIVRPFNLGNKANSSGRKVAPKPRNEDDGYENLSLLRAIGRGCHLDLASLPQPDVVAASNQVNCWESPTVFGAAEKEM